MWLVKKLLFHQLAEIDCIDKNITQHKHNQMPQWAWRKAEILHLTVESVFGIWLLTPIKK